MSVTWYAEERNQRPSDLSEVQMTNKGIPVLFSSHSTTGDGLVTPYSAGAVQVPTAVQCSY